VEIDSSFSFKNLGLDVDDTVAAEGDRLLFGSGKLCLDCSGAGHDDERMAGPWQMRMALPDRTTWLRLADKVGSLVPEEKGGCRLRRFLAGIILGDGLSAAGGDPFDRKLISCLIGIQQAVKDDNASDAAEWANALIGTGVGLTPSGDDMLVGILAAWGLQATTDGQLVFIETVKEYLIRSLAGRTTSISEAFLFHALQGRFSDRVTEFAVAALAQNDFEVEATVTKLLAFGASSGVDTLCGVVFGCGTWTFGFCHTRPVQVS